MDPVSLVWAEFPLFHNLIWVHYFRTTRMIINKYSNNFYILVIGEYLVLPGKLTCPLKINGWKMYFLLRVSFRGCLFIVYPLRINVNGSDIYLFLYARTTKVPAGFQAPLMLAYGCRML